MDASLYLDALILGAVQGLTEFLPVSSSGHLAVVENLLWTTKLREGISLEVFLHLGTLLSLALFYAFPGRQKAGSFVQHPIRTGVLLVVASVPAAAGWFLFSDWIERAFDSIRAVGAGFVVSAAMLFLADRYRRMEGREAVRMSDALIMGFVQAVAMFPGVSRSGLTLSAGLLMGLRPDVAVGFAFLMAVPAILGANAVHAKVLLKVMGSPDGPAYALGGAAAMVVGLGAIAAVYAVAQKARLKMFSFYLLGLAAVVLLWS